MNNNKKARKSKLERSSSKTKYHSINKVEVEDVDQIEPVENDQVFDIMDKIRSDSPT